MAENILYNRPEASSVHLEDELSGNESNKEIQEMDISEGDRKVTRSKCELCVVKNPLSENMTAFLCFICEMYVCINCISDHRLHKGMKVGNLERESDKKEEGIENNKMGQQSKDEKAKSTVKGLRKYPKRMRLEESKREREWEKSEDMENASESERKSMLIEFVDALIHESELERKEKLMANHVNIYDRVEVKHELDDEDCNITGLCGLENKRWVVCDYGNFCIKIFKLGSNVLQRYLRFDSQPWDVTEILERQNLTPSHSVPGSISGTPVTDQTEQDTKCFIAVTLTWKRQIMFVALHKKPAVAHKIVSTEKSCYSILYHDDKIFTVGREDLSPCSVYIKSTDGDTLYEFMTDTTFYVPHLAVISGRVYLAYRSNDKLQCRADDGQVISENVIERSRPEGISVDKDNNVYVCALLHDKIYKLNPDLTLRKSLLDETTDYIEKPDMLCYYRDKLFVSHYLLSSLDNFVTVIRLL